MPQDVVSGQIFCPLARGPRHAGQKFTLALMSKLALQFGHFAFMSLICLSLVISSQTKGTSDSVWPMNIPMAMGLFEIPLKKLAITFGDSCEFYAYPETWSTLTGTEDC